MPRQRRDARREGLGVLTVCEGQRANPDGLEHARGAQLFGHVLGVKVPRRARAAGRDAAYVPAAEGEGREVRYEELWRCACVRRHVRDASHRTASSRPRRASSAGAAAPRTGPPRVASFDARRPGAPTRRRAAADLLPKPRFTVVGRAPRAPSSAVVGLTAAPSSAATPEPSSILRTSSLSDSRFFAAQPSTP